MSSPKESTEAEVNDAIERVVAKKSEWARLPAAQKAVILQACLDNLKKEIEPWVRNGCLNTGYEYNNPAHGHLVGEVYFKGPAICASWMNSILVTLRTIASTGAPPKPAAVERRRDGSYAATVHPTNAFETVLAGGVVNQVFTIPDSKDFTQFNPMELPGGVVAILGAGNYDGPNDVLHTLFLENKVGIFKPNPVNDFTAANTYNVFKPLIDRGYLAYVYGAAKVGQQLVNHPKVDEVTMTGSCLTYDAIVWGGSANKPKAESKEKQPIVKKPVKAELGSVNPYIIVPGVWTEAQLNAHAELLVAAKMMNNGHICASPQVVLTCKNWAQRDAFLAKVRQLLATYPGTRPYYPQCDRSYKQQLDALAKAVGKDGDSLILHNPDLFPNQQHPMFATGVPADAFVVKQEAFCPVLAEVCLDTDASGKDFIPAAVDFANNKIWGSLTCTMIIDTATQKANSEVFEKAIDDLKFGAIGINQLAAFSVVYGQMIWGAYPRHSMYDIQSGTGKLGNAFCIDNPIKCLIRAPFTHPGQSKIKRGNAAAKEAQLAVNLLTHNTWYRLVRMLGFVITGL